MKPYNSILAKSISNGGTTLIEHTMHVIEAIEVIAHYCGMDVEIARKGAILHDLGKTSPVFQERLKDEFKYTIVTKPFRHEIASLFFISLLNEGIHPQIIDMVIAHHKSILRDGARLGILDLDEDWGNAFALHIQDWEKWSPTALEILNYFGWQTRPIDRDEAKANYQKVVEHCERKGLGWSKWKGLMVAADHYASALGAKTGQNISRAFKKPGLAYYNRKSDLYPLSLIHADDHRKHTLVTAPTGAGKTDFLIRRCKGRFFYTLPFQASINAMYNRISEDLRNDNPDLDIRLLHAASRVIVNQKMNSIEEKALQDKVGSAIKILTPHQIASLVFGTRGYEAMLLDISGCDVILDEIHTYTGITKAIVLKIVEILNHFDCRIHIGTATMPTKLYQEILKILGEENVYQVSLDNDVLDTYDRHIVHKIQNFEKALPIISQAIDCNRKVLIVCNRVSTAQNLFEQLKMHYSSVKMLLIHSRFKRGERAILENKLKSEFDKGTGPCIVVSTQVVEVSLDISFDLMVTEAAPLDSLVQRFGRINRKRSPATIGKYKPVYVIEPPDNKKDAKPYELELTQKTYEILPDGELLRERNIREMLDSVFEKIESRQIEQSSRFKNGEFHLKELSHEPKSVLLESLEIDSVSCIVQGDVPLYRKANSDERISFEIPYHYWSLANKNLDVVNFGNHPFVIPDKAYSPVLGVLSEYIEPMYYNRDEQFL